MIQSNSGTANTVRRRGRLPEPNADAGVQAALAFEAMDELRETPNDVPVTKMALSLTGRAAPGSHLWFGFWSDPYSEAERFSS